MKGENPGRSGGLEDAAAGLDCNGADQLNRPEVSERRERLTGTRARQTARLRKMWSSCLRVARPDLADLDRSRLVASPRLVLFVNRLLLIPKLLLEACYVAGDLGFRRAFEDHAAHFSASAPF